jgi:hypothetical protein
MPPVFGPPGGVPAPETNPHHRTYMMPDFTIALAIGLVIGFILGYGLRAIISYRRYQRANTTIVPFLSLVCLTARPAAASHGQNDTSRKSRGPVFQCPLFAVKLAYPDSAPGGARTLRRIREVVCPALSNRSN